MPSRVSYSESSLKAELEVVRRKVSIKETGSSWNIIEQGIIQLTECCKSGGCKLTADMVTGIRSLSKSIIAAMNSERTRLSRSAVEFLTVLSAGLGPAFEPLVQVFMPTLIGLCAQTSKVFASRAKACILAIVKHTQSPSILPYLAESIYSKSLLLRLAAAEGVFAGLNCFSHPDGTRDRHIEDVIKFASLDANEDVKATGEKILQAYKALLPGFGKRVFAPFPVVRVNGAAISQSSEVPSSCRPVGSSVRQGALRAPWQAGPWRGPKSAPTSVSPPSDPKRNPITANMRLVKPTSTTTVRPSSRTAPPKAEHPGTRCTSSRQPPTRETKLQTATSQVPRGKAAASRSSKLEQKKLAKGERPVTKVTNPVVKALPRRRKATVENILPPSLAATRPTTTPLLSSKIHSTSFLPSTPIRPNVSLSLLSAETPLQTQTYGTHIIAHAHTPNNSSRFQGCEMRALDKFDIESGTPLKSFVLCTPSRTATGRIRRSPFRPCRDSCRQKVPPTSIRRESLLLPPRPVNQVKTPVPSHLVVDAERSISDSADITGYLEEMQDLLLAMQTNLVDGWAAKMEAMGLRSALPRT